MDIFAWIRNASRENFFNSFAMDFKAWTYEIYNDYNVGAFVDMYVGDMEAIDWLNSEADQKGNDRPYPNAI